ncbi:hypothetical protein NA655_22035, partial [Pseudomonas kuykendallii]|nr:hypothetical protein [Pseudomonas kuykendallii]
MLLIIISTSVLRHKHPHELLDSVVKERFDQVFRLNRGRAFYSSLSICQAYFRKSLFYSTACRFRSFKLLVSGRRILQRSNPLSTPLFPLPIISIEATNRIKPPPCQPGAFYSNPPPMQPSLFAQPIDLQEVLLEDCAGSGAHY